MILLTHYGDDMFIMSGRLSDNKWVDIDKRNLMSWGYYGDVWLHFCFPTFPNVCWVLFIHQE
ncbi:MAG: hypothetical protein ACTSUK_03520 [Promethearchaeota archaeon]